MVCFGQAILDNPNGIAAATLSAFRFFTSLIVTRAQRFLLCLVLASLLEQSPWRSNFYFVSSRPTLLNNPNGIVDAAESWSKFSAALRTTRQQDAAFSWQAYWSIPMARGPILYFLKASQHHCIKSLPVLTPAAKHSDRDSSQWKGPRSHQPTRYTQTRKSLQRAPCSDASQWNAGAIRPKTRQDLATELFPMERQRSDTNLFMFSKALRNGMPMARTLLWL